MFGVYYLSIVGELVSLKYNPLILFCLLALSTLLTFGCLESNNTITPPFSTSQFVRQATDLNYTDWKNNDYNNMVLVFDGNKISVADANALDIALPDLSAFVPFQGAGADLNLGLNSILANRFSGAVNMPYGVSSSANNTSTKQVTIPNFTAQAGDIFAVKFTKGSIITSSWDLYVSGVNLGKVYVNGSTSAGDYLKVSTGGVILFYYDGERVNAVGTAYTNPFDRLSLDGSYARPVETVYAWKVAMEDGAGRFRPIIKTSGSTGNNDYPNTAGFKLGGYMVLNDSANNYGTTSSMGIDFTSNGLAGISYNLNSTLTSYLPLYWKGKVKSDGLFYFDQASYTSWYTQALPTKEDGFVYIYVGWASTTTAFFIVPNHPAYEFKNGSIRLWEHVLGDENSYSNFDVNGTLRMTGEATVWDDLYTQVASAKLPAAHYPDWSAFTTNTSAYTFKIGDYADLGTVEVLHNYKEGSDLELHLHLATNSVDGSDRNVTYQIFYSWTNSNSGAFAFPEDSNCIATLTIPASTPTRSSYYLDMCDINGVGKLLGSQLKTRVKRIANPIGTEPGSDPFLGMVGVHYEISKLGSNYMHGD